MKGKVSLAIVIPHVRNELKASEKLSLKHWQEHLSHFDTFAVSPPDISSPHHKINSKHFAPKHFTSVRSYSELLLTEEFYQSFAEYDYILIYQLDALVFSNDLSAWIDKKISYVGAPWSETMIGKWTSSSNDLRGGNGGLSLRSISESLKVLSAVNQAAQYSFSGRWGQWGWFGINFFLGKTKSRWLKCPAYQYPFNEDGFWSFEAVKYSSTFTPATRKDSLRFAFETNPQKCFLENNQQLPFGVHAWEKYDKEFWVKKLSFLS